MRQAERGLIGKKIMNRQFWASWMVNSNPRHGGRFCPPCPCPCPWTLGDGSVRMSHRVPQNGKLPRTSI